MRVLSVVLLPLLLLVDRLLRTSTKGTRSRPGGDRRRARRRRGAVRAAGIRGGDRRAQQAHDAVAQRDYRLALTRALDACDRAQDAAKGAADGKARARSEAESAINAATAALGRLQGRIKAEGPRLPRADARCR